MVIEHKYLSIVIWFLATLVVAPIIFLIIFIPGSSDKFKLQLDKVFSED